MARIKLTDEKLISIVVQFHKYRKRFFPYFSSSFAREKKLTIDTNSSLTTSAVNLTYTFSTTGKLCCNYHIVAIAKFLLKYTKIIVIFLWIKPIFNTAKAASENDIHFSCQFHQHFTRSFYTRRSQKHKNTVKSSVSFYAFGLCACINQLFPERFTDLEL
jgi:hypothetical protein